MELFDAGGRARELRASPLFAIGPSVPGSFVVLGGNKSLLFNAEYLISIMSQVRIVTATPPSGRRERQEQRQRIVARPEYRAVTRRRRR